MPGARRYTTIKVVRHGLGGWWAYVNVSPWCSERDWVLGRRGYSTRNRCIRYAVQDLLEVGIDRVLVAKSDKCWTMYLDGVKAK